MARKPKTQPSPEVAAAVSVPELASVPAPRGRKPKAAAHSPTSLTAASIDDPTTDGVEADAAKGPVKKAPSRRGSGRQPKTQPSPDVATAVPVPALIDRRGRGGRRPKAFTSPPASLATASMDDPATDAARTVAAKAGPTRTPSRRGPGRKRKQAAGAGAATLRPAASGPEAVARTASALQWDRATGAVRFDWPEIERVASAEGPNQGMAKLLVAARAEGAGSRWPL